MGKTILFIFFLIAIIAGPWYLNVKFKKYCPSYNGKILWTLIVFPIWFIVEELYVAIDFLKHNIILAIIYFIGWSGMVYLGVKNYKDLFNISNDNLNKIHNHTNGILAIFLITVTISTLVISKGDILIYTLLTYFIMGGFIYYFTNLMIKEFKRLFADKDSSVTSTNRVIEQENHITLSEDSTSQEGHKSITDIKDRLYNLKELYNDGVLSTEEFNKLKKETLSEII